MNPIINFPEIKSVLGAAINNNHKNWESSIANVPHKWYWLII